MYIFDTFLSYTFTQASGVINSAETGIILICIRFWTFASVGPSNILDKIPQCSTSISGSYLQIGLQSRLREMA